MKKIISLILIICTFSLCLASCSSLGSDKQAAEALATKEAKQYYSEYFEGQTLSGVKYYDCSTSIESSIFEDGKYIVKVSLRCEMQSGGYTAPSYHLMDIEYFITVTNGVATVIDTEYYL